MDDISLSTQRYGELKLSIRPTITELGFDVAGSNFQDAHPDTADRYEEQRFETYKMSNEENHLFGLEDGEASPSAKDAPPAEEEAAPPTERICTRLGLRDSNRMIKVNVSNSAGEWILHEHLLSTNSDLAKAAVTHDSTEKTSNTIQLPDADAEAFEFFADYLYTQKLDASKMTLDQLLKTYILADYMGAPRFADIVFQKLHKQTHNESFVYTAQQIEYVLSNTLPVQPLRTLLLDQIGRGILKKKYNFKEHADRQILEPYMGDLMDAVFRTIAESTTESVIFGGGEGLLCPPYPLVTRYLKHDLSHTAVEDDEPADSDSVTSATTSATPEPYEAILGRSAIQYVMEASGATRARAIAALKANNNRWGQAIKQLKL